MKNILHVLATPRTFKAGETVVYIIDTMFEQGYAVGILENDEHSVYCFGLNAQLTGVRRTFTIDGKHRRGNDIRSLLTIEEARECGLNIIIPIPDKALVWCWEDDLSYTRHAKFYDKRNGCTFESTGNRNGYPHDNYVQITEEEIKASPMLQSLMAKIDSLEA